MQILFHLNLLKLEYHSHCERSEAIFIEMKNYFVYILTNANDTVLYTGMTNSLMRRVWEHKAKLIDGFTKKYDIDKLVYFEAFSSPSDAIKREKQIKSGSRNKKIELINKFNPKWKDLYNFNKIYK